MFQARTTFLLLLICALPISAKAAGNECYNEYYACNISPIAQSDPQGCTVQYHACLKEVEEGAARSVRHRQEQEFRSSRAGGHGGGFENREPETSLAAQPLTILNARPAKFTDIPLSPVRAMKRADEVSPCPQSAYPYQGTAGIVCTSTGSIANHNLVAARGKVVGEMMGLFAEISQTSPGGK